MKQMLQSKVTGNKYNLNLSSYAALGAGLGSSPVTQALNTTIQDM